jgi:hypothetical protein
LLMRGFIVIGIRLKWTVDCHKIFVYWSGGRA